MRNMELVSPTELHRCLLRFKPALTEIQDGPTATLTSLQLSIIYTDKLSVKPLVRCRMSYFEVSPIGVPIVIHWLQLMGIAVTLVLAILVDWCRVTPLTVGPSV